MIKKKKPTERTIIEIDDLLVDGKPPWHNVTYAEPGAGKSRFFAQMPKPLDVALFDAMGKDIPYWLRWMKEPPSVSKIQVDGKTEIPYRLVMKGKTLLVRINYFHDRVIDEPAAYAKYLDHLARVGRAMEKGEIKSHVTDSISQAYLLARKWSQYDLKAGVKDPRLWYAEGTDLLEEACMAILPALPLNVGIACHIMKTKIEAEGGLLRTPNLPGRLGNNAAFAAQWPEIYRLHVTREQGKVHRELQTIPDERYIAATQIGAPDGCKPSWEAIWEAWKA